MAEPTSNESSTGTDGDSDQEFDPSAEMMINDFDDEHTLDEEEDLTDEFTIKNEIDQLTKEQEMPIEELKKLYGIDQQPSTSNIAEMSESANTLGQTSPQSNLNQQISDSSDDDSEDFSESQDWRRTIQVGSDFQAVIPEGLKHYDENFTENDKLLWKPSSNSNINIDHYLLEYSKLMYPDDESLVDFQLPIGSHIKDDEQALFTLLQCKYDIKEALKARERGNEIKAPISEPMTPWSEEECRAFESGLRTFGKDFFEIKYNRIPTRSVGEVISFYYLWKKTVRHDIFTNKYRLEKKKYSLHPGTTDYMDRFLDEQENVSLTPINNNNPTNVQISSSNNSSSSLNHHLNLNQTNRQSSSPSSTTLNSIAGHSRTINISPNETQTILINSDYVSNNDNKLVVCTGSNRTNFFNNTTPTETSPNTTTIVVGKNPVVIDGSWVTTGTSTTPSVSIYKIPPSFNR